MANFGSFEYGTSVVYGPTDGGSAIESVDVLDENKIRITFTDPVIVDEALLDPENYTIEFSDNLGFTDVLPRSVYAGGTRDDRGEQTQTNTVTTRVVELITDYHTSGQGYRITISNVTATNGAGVFPDPVNVIARRTKVESILRSLPAHYNKRQDGIIRSLLTAIGLEDDRIGGSLNEEIFIPTVFSAPPSIDPPVNTIAPVISGTVEIGQVLSATTGTWTNSPTGYTYQWQRDGVDIGGATSSTYTVVDADIGPGTAGTGTGIRCRVIGSNSAGSGSPAASNALVFDHATYLPSTAIGISTAGLTLADSDTTVDQWVSTLGGASASATAPTATNRPAHLAIGGVGGRPAIEGDGIDDVLAGTYLLGSALSDLEIGVVGEWMSYGVAANAIALNASYRIQQTTTTFQARVGVTATATTGWSGVIAHFSGDSVEGGDVNVRVGGTVENTASPGGAALADGGAFTLFARTNAGGNPGNLRAQAWYVSRKLTDDQRTHLRALLTYHTGVSC